MRDLVFVLLDKTESSIRFAFSLRNLPSVRKVSLHQEEKEFFAFQSEYLENWFTERRLPPVALLKQGSYCGLLYFKRVEDPTKRRRPTVEISIIVDEPFQGKGVGKAALKKAIIWAKEQGYDQVLAKILPHNMRSKHTFSSVGFQFLDVFSEVLFDTAEHIPCERWIYTEQIHPLFSRVFVVAECGSNWKTADAREDRKCAFALIDAAKEAGCDAVKFQSFRPENLYAYKAGKAAYLQEKGVEKSMEELFQELIMPDELFIEVVEYAKKMQIEFMCTPFSEEDFDRVDPYVQYHKIASYELTHLNLLEKAAHSNKPLFLSTGGATAEEVAFSVRYYRKCGGSRLVLLQCTAAYPAPANSLNLAAIAWMGECFKVPTGLSDHSLDPILAPVAAVALGAQVIEKHITLDRTLPGPDHSYAITPSELKEMVKAIRVVETMRGEAFKHPQEIEQELIQFAQRSVQAIEEIEIGDLLQEGSNIAILRSGNQIKGVHPRFLPSIEGKPAKRAIARGDGVLHGDW